MSSTTDWDRITRENQAKRPSCKRQSCLGCEGLDICCLDLMRKATVEWTRDWPTKPGTYWFYGWDFGKKSKLTGEKLEPKYHIVEVKKCRGSDVILIGDGHIWYREEGADGWWTPVTFPPPPKEG